MKTSTFRFRRQAKSRVSGSLSVGALTAALIAMAALLILAAPAPADAAGCANETIRVDQGQAALALPDCRAYEMVSPPGSIPQYGPKTLSSADGDGVAYFSFYPYAAAESNGTFLLATRGADGWSTQSLIPPQGGASLTESLQCDPSLIFSEDLSQAILIDGLNEAEVPLENGVDQPGHCEGDQPPLVSGEPRGYTNLFLRNTAGGSWQLVPVTPAGITPANTTLQGASADFSRIYFSSRASLTPEAPNGENLYDWAGGKVVLVTRDPAGAPVTGELVNGYYGSEGEVASFTNPISLDGERAFFYADGKLYVRQNAAQEQSAVTGSGECTEPAKACTIQIDASQGPGPGGGGSFWYANREGSRVFFTDESRLTADSTASAGNADLYECDIVEVAGRLGCELTDLSVGVVESADVLGVSGISEDGSYVYFVANGDLTGEQKNSQGAKAISGNCRPVPVDSSGKCNLYLWHDGATTFVTTLLGTDEWDWGTTSDGNVWNHLQAETTARVAPDGRFIAFPSEARLTGYDNTPAQPEDCVTEWPGGSEDPPCTELFVYEVEAGQLVCVSCGPANGLPTAPTGFLRPGANSTFKRTGVNHLARNVADNGRVFFNTAEALAPQDVNGKRDVYEYEDGRAYLISSGSAAAGSSEFLEASPGGHDVFFKTSQALLGADTDSSISLYDAREDGGFTEPAAMSDECEGEGCRGSASAPTAGATPATSHFEGAGNPKPLICPKSKRKVTRHGKEACVRRQRHKRRRRARTHRHRHAGSKHHHGRSHR